MTVVGLLKCLPNFCVDKARESIGFVAQKSVTLFFWIPAD